MASTVLRYSVYFDRMASRTLIKRCVDKLRKSDGSTRALSIGCVKYAGLVSSNLPEPIQKSLDEDTRAHRPKFITVNETEDVSLVSGIPEDHIKNRTVRIYQPAKNSMQSGTDNIKHWEIDFDTRERWENPLIGWCSTGDPMSNLKVEFVSAEDAIDHCKKMKWQYYIQKPNIDEPKPRSYGANFAWNKRTRVSTK